MPVDRLEASGLAAACSCCSVTCRVLHCLTHSRACSAPPCWLLVEVLPCACCGSGFPAAWQQVTCSSAHDLGEGHLGFLLILLYTRHSSCVHAWPGWRVAWRSWVTLLGAPPLIFAAPKVPVLCELPAAHRLSCTVASGGCPGEAIAWPRTLLAALQPARSPCLRLGQRPAGAECSRQPRVPPPGAIRGAVAAPPNRRPVRRSRSAPGRS